MAKVQPLQCWQHLQSTLHKECALFPNSSAIALLRAHLHAETHHLGYLIPTQVQLNQSMQSIEMVDTSQLVACQVKDTQMAEVREILHLSYLQGHVACVCVCVCVYVCVCVCMYVCMYV